MGASAGLCNGGRGQPLAPHRPRCTAREAVFWAAVVALLALVVGVQLAEAARMHLHYRAFFNTLAGRNQVDCLTAVSVTCLYDVYSSSSRCRWLRELEPMAKVGHSICVYDLREPRS